MGDSDLERKTRLIQAHHGQVPFLGDGTPAFSLIEFSLTELCNRKCVFCPRHDPKVYPNRAEHLDVFKFALIVDELADLEYAGKILFSGFGEPLWHPDLLDLVLECRWLHRARLEIVTNGDRLTAGRLRELLDAGVATFIISLYDGPEQIPHFERMRDEAGATADQVILRVRYLPANERFGLIPTNRGGLVSIPEAGIGCQQFPLQRPCYYPSYQMVVDWDGKVYACPHDWGKVGPVGDLAQQGVREVWMGAEMTRRRMALGGGDRSLEPCRRCDANAMLIGGEHWVAWKQPERELEAKP